MARMSLILRAAMLVAACAILLARAGAERSAAGGFTVDTPVDAVDANPGDGNCATAAANCSLRAATERLPSVRAEN